MEKKAFDLSTGDPNSYSCPDDAVVKHIHLKLNVDFSRKILVGSVDLTVERKEGVHTLVLDCKEQHISNVTDTATGQELKYSVGEPVLTFGSKLEINLPSSSEKSLQVKIRYETSVNASALQWLDPEQTAEGTHPYMFSQCQAIHCRSMIPCQDTPSVKTTYSAEVTAPSELVVLMSALRAGVHAETGNGLSVHRFHQPVPIPAYLLAIAVGRLESQQIGPRTHVWSEKGVVNKAAYEFAETEKMLATAEEICGPYVWGIYDLLVLPPSFPFGGMENPCLTFVTPTLLAGDRSLADVVAHEIAHSWTGNLVTNCNFEHFWLNEGFTMFVERKIISRLSGEKSRQFSAIEGLKDLQETILHRGEKDPLTCLVPRLLGIDPDDSFSTVPYEKGHTLLYHLEELVGGQDVFDPFLRAYLDRFKYKSIDTDDFKTFLYEYFPKHEALMSVDWDAWLHTPGMPPVIPAYDTTLATTCSELCKRWLEGSVDSADSFTPEDITSLSSAQIREFLSLLLLSPPLPIKKLETMAEVYKFDLVTNSEIRFRWLRLCLKAKWKVQVDPALKFVTEQGRMKFVRPIYRDLYAWEETRSAAIANFKAHRNSMMYVAAHTVAKDLHLGEKD